MKGHRKTDNGHLELLAQTIPPREEFDIVGLIEAVAYYKTLIGLKCLRKEHEIAKSQITFDLAIHFKEVMTAPGYKSRSEYADWWGPMRGNSIL